MARSADLFGSRATLETRGGPVVYYRLDALSQAAGTDLARLPFTVKIIAENLLRRFDGRVVTEADVRAIAGWRAGAAPQHELPYLPGRVLLQDFTGVPAVVDLAAMRSAMARLGGDPEKINPLAA